MLLTYTSSCDCNLVLLISYHSLQAPLPPLLCLLTEQVVLTLKIECNKKKIIPTCYDSLGLMGGGRGPTSVGQIQSFSSTAVLTNVVKCCSSTLFNQSIINNEHAKQSFIHYLQSIPRYEKPNIFGANWLTTE